MNFPIPNADVLAIPTHIARVRAWREQAVVEHPTLGEVRPRLGVAHRYLKPLVRGAEWFDLAAPPEVNEATCETMEWARECERLAQAKEEAFRQACDDMGIPGGKERVEDRCDQCGCASTLGTLYYRPDANAVPTPVLFVGDCCADEGGE